MKKQFHKLLERQIKKHFESIEDLPDEMNALLKDISNTYGNFDDDFRLLQNSIEISSSELRLAFQKQKDDAEKQKETINKIKEAISAIKPSEKQILQKDLELDTHQMFDTLLKLIDERKKAEEEILKLSLAVEQNPASIVITNIDGNIVYVNQRFCELTGYEKEEVWGKNPNILKSDHAPREFYKELWDTITQGKEWQGEFLNKKKNGELYWELASISAVKNSKGEVINFLAIKEDITERKATQATLENERTLFRTIIDLIPDAVYVKDLNFRKILSNPTDVKFSGKSNEEEVLGKTDYELLPPKVAQKSYEEDKQVLETGNPILRAEGTLIDNDKEEHSLLISKVPLYNIQEKITGIVGVTHDITTIKEARTALQKAHKSLADVLNAAKHTSIIASDTEGLITVFSKGAENITGYSASEMVGKQTPIILHLEPEVERRSVELSKEAGRRVSGFETFVYNAKHHQHEERNWTYIRKDGSTLVVNLIVTAIRDEHNIITGFLGIAHDITLQKQYEEGLLRARQEAEMANKAKSEFLANVSHEIRTPMNAIIGFAEILMSKIAEPSYKEHIKTILNSGRTLLSLINDILDLSKIEAGKLEIEYEPVHLPSVINEIQQVFMPKVKLKQLEFEIISSPDLPEYIFMDQVRLNQILFNVVGNAIKFTDKGYIRLETKAESPTSPEIIDLTIEIEDTGIGIPQSQIETIFEAFTQQSGQSTRKYEGTGLGLAISKRLTEKMNGTISIKSEVGKGSTFTICFKEIKLSSSKQLQEASKNPGSGDLVFEPATVMIVDDIDFNIKILRSMLDYPNLKFVEATSGEEAIEMLEHEKPDIIFMDIRMPGMSGISATEIIKYKLKIKAPVIAFTASAMQSQLAQIKVLFDGLLYKPVTQKFLQEVIRKYLVHTFKTKEEKAKPKEEPKLDTECIEANPEMAILLQQELYEQWKEISQSLVLFEIEEFCDRILQVSIKYKCPVFIEYAKKLKSNLKTFDVELIEKTISEFEIIYNKLQQNS